MEVQTTSPGGSRKRRLVFLTVNSSYSHSSLALPLLHSACRSLTQWEWIRLDMLLTDDVHSAVRTIAETRCDLLAADLYLFNREKALEVLRRYHVLDPVCRIVAGGPECLGQGAVDLQQEMPWLDGIFRGEGEEIFREYLAHFDDADRVTKGILPREGNGEFSAWAGSPYPVTDPFFVTEKPFVQLETSRGCPMKCFYCTSGGTHPRYRTLDQVREELHLLAGRGVQEVRVLDRTFNLPQERGLALLRMFREEFAMMRFHLELHPQFLGEALRQELRRALPGQLHIEVGIQCLDHRVQQLSGRRSDNAAALDGLAFLTAQTAFETHADLLSGLPGQKWHHILDDAATLMKVQVAEIQLEVLKALPGTPLREIAAAYGLQYSPSAPYDVMRSSTMTLEEMQFARDLSRLLDMTYNHRFLHPAMLVMDQECPDLLPRLLAYFHRNGGNSGVLWDLPRRFRFLLDFCREFYLEKAPRELAYRWLLAGFPPGQGGDLYSEKADRVPEGARLQSGSPECLPARETRLYRLPMADQVCFLAYNRGYSPNRPAAIWIQPAGGAAMESEPAKGNGAVAFTFDDFDPEGWVTAIGLFQKFDASATFFFSGTLTAQHLEVMKKLADAGHAIGLHTLTHADAVPLAEGDTMEAYFDREIRPQLDLCRAHGISIRSFAYPNNRHTPETDAFLYGFFDFLRVGRGPEKQVIYIPREKITGKMLLPGGGIGKYYQSELPRLIDILDYAADHDLLTVFFSHRICADADGVHISTEMLEALLAHARKRHMQIVSSEQVPTLQSSITKKG